MTKTKASHNSTLDIIKTFNSNEIFHLDSVKQNVTCSLTNTTPCCVINLEIRSWRKDRNRCGFHHNYDNRNIILGWIDLWWKYVKIWELYVASIIHLNTQWIGGNAVFCLQSIFWSYIFLLCSDLLIGKIYSMLNIKTPWQNILL